MPNYGDVALGLGPKWNRNAYQNTEQVLRIIGHENGEADLYLTKEPDAEHQFRWIDASDKSEVTAARMRGYEFVKKDKWTKRVDYLWEWNAEEFVFFGGQVAMARPKAKWLEDEARRGAMNKQARADSDAEIDRLPAGLVAANAEPKQRRRGI